MRGALWTFASVVVATLAVAVPAHAEGELTREEYVALVEPICEKNATVNKRVLQGARGRVNDGKLNAAGGQFIRASDAFGATVRELSAVPRPAADDTRLQRWFGFLRIVAKNLRNIGKALKEGDKIKATHDSIRAERSGNAANNVSFAFGFRHCRLTPSRFR